MKNNGLLAISLDFELLWGVFDTLNWKDKREYFSNTREVIPSVLKLFSQYQIHATWATVGMLFNRSWEEWNKNIPANLPAYSNKALSAYHYGRKIQEKNSEKMCFAPDLIEEISATPNQEIGTHTYSHYYCLEPGQDIIAFRDDLQLAIKMAGNFGIELRSLVFPRNQIRQEYLQVCRQLGIRNIRSNPKDWYWRDPRSENMLVKLARTGDAYLPLGRKSYIIYPSEGSGFLPMEQKASRFLRPYERKKILQDLKLRRILAEMTGAAERSEIYHLWWHPHNFGKHPEESLRDLKTILEHYKYLQSTFNFRSANMEEVGNYSV